MRSMQSKNLIVLTSSRDRIEKFMFYYDRLGKSDDVNLAIIVDDRRDETLLEAAREFHYDVFSIKEAIRYAKETYCKDTKHFDEISEDLYRVSIKLLIFPWAHYALGCEKTFLIDDDILVTRPLDYLFDIGDNVVIRESLSRHTERSLAVMHDIFGDELKKYCDETIAKKFLINSGTMIYSYDENDHLEEYVNKFFSSTACRDHLLKNFNNNGGKIKGKTWITEQYFYGCFFNLLGPHRCGSFKSKDVKLCSKKYDPKKDVVNPRKCPTMIHMLNRDKTDQFAVWEKYIKETIL